MPVVGSLTKEECAQRVDRAIKHAPFVKFMLDALEKAGCKVDPSSFITVEDCDAEIVGGFRPEEGVAVCHNHLSSQAQVEVALTHELIHAYDHCRIRGMRWENCEHHACSEIRAANLSGDCHFSQEIGRGNFGWQKQHQKCVRRRAELSVSMNPHCQEGKAKEAIDKVFDTCFADTAPFIRIP